MCCICIVFVLHSNIVFVLLVSLALLFNEYAVILTHGLYIFNPSFHFGLYCRAVYNAERLSFRDSFFSSNFYTKAI